MASGPSLDDLIKGVAKEKLDSPCKERDLKTLALSTTRWRLLAPFLGFDESEEEDIVREYQDNIRRQTIALYVRWRAKAPLRATYRKLTKILYELKRIDLVEKAIELLSRSDDHGEIGEDDDEYTVYLRRMYRTQVPCHTLQWPPVPHCEYVSLALVQEDDELQRRNTEDDGLRKASIQQIMEKKKQVVLDRIMTLDQAHRKVVVVEGAPGVGKSTFALHACQQWATGLLFENYMYVILVQLQDPAVQEATRLADILPHRPTEDAADVSAKIVSMDGEKTLFIIDGWDEFPPQCQKKSLIHKILFQPHLVGVNMSTVLITSRANSSADLHRIASSRVQILGFPPAEVRDYFEKVFKDSSKVDRLYAHLRQHPSLHSSCHIPLNAAIIAHVYSYKTLPRTLHDAFCTLVLNCIIHDVSRRTPDRELKVTSLSNLPPDLQRQLNQIALLAYTGARHSKGTFSEEDLKQFEFPTDFPTLGLVQVIEHFALFHKSKHYTFMHSSVQQLLTAFHISQWAPAQQADVFAKSFSLSNFSPIAVFLSFDPQAYLLNIFQYFAGFTKLQGTELQESVLQVVHNYKEVCNAPLIVLRHTFSIMRTRPFRSLVRCLYEAENESLCELVASRLEGEINLTHVPLDLYEFLSVSYLLRFFKCEETVSLVLSVSFVGDEALKHLFKEFKGQTCSLKVNLADNHISAKGIPSIVPLLRTNKLVDLTLSSNSISDEGAECIASALKSNTSLLVLTLQSCGISDVGVNEIAVALSRNCTLQELCLSKNPFTNDGLMLLSDGLAKNQGLRKLRVNPDIDLRMKALLKYNPTLSPVTSEGLQLFVCGLVDNAHITELDVGEFGARDNDVMQAVKLVNEQRKRSGIQVLTVFCSEYLLAQFEL